MSPNSIRIIFIMFSVAELITNAFLVILNIRRAKRNRDMIPVWFRDHISRNDYARSVNYTIEKGIFSLVSDIFGSIIILVLVISGFFGILDDAVSKAGFMPYVEGIVYFGILALGMYILNLPFSLYSIFRIEKKYGFNRMTMRMFFLDQIKSLVVSGILVSVLLSGLFFFMDKSGSLWWIIASAGIIGFQVFLNLIYPVVIAPLFNKFTPLAEGELKETLSAMAERNNFAVKGIFVMDGSRRSTHSNAYFTGFGKVKRIVLFDTLIEKLTSSQLAGVLAHEIGHEKKHHLLKGLVLSFFMTVLVFFAMDQLMNYLPLYRAFGFTRISYHAILVIVVFCSGPFAFFITPVFSIWSRKHEYEADRYAVDACGNSEDLKQGLIVLAKENLSNLTPHPFYSFFKYSHPALEERIKAIDSAYAAGDS